MLQAFAVINSFISKLMDFTLVGNLKFSAIFYFAIFTSAALIFYKYLGK